MEPNPPTRKTKTVQLALSTTEQLDKLGARGDTYNDIIDKILASYDWRHEAKHDIALNEAEEIQQRISRLEESLLELKKDVEKLQGIFNFGQRMSDFSGMKIVKKAEDERD